MKNMTPKISVIMSVYNGEKYLNETIESILNQSEKSFEFIIINDCSTDSSFEILSKYQKQDERIILINNQENLRLPASLNKGIKIAKGKYIARMDADDIALSNRFEVQLGVMEKNQDIDFLGSMVECFYDSSNDAVVYASKENMEELHFNFISVSGRLHDTAELISKETYKTTRICHSSLFGKTDVFKKLMYREDVFAEDWDLYNRAINRGFKISKVPEILINYRIVNSGMCGQFNSQPHTEMRKKIKKLNNGILKDSILTKSYVTAFKFFWYHYMRYQILSFLLTLKYFTIKMFKIPIFNFMKFIYKSLSDRNLLRLFFVLNRLNKFKFIHKIPLFNRVLRLSLLVLNNNPKIMPLNYESISTGKHFNIGVWTIEKKWAMGGLNTILKMIPELISNDNKVRIINYGIHSEELKSEFIAFLSDIFGWSDTVLNSIEIISSTTYKNRALEFNKNDRFIAGFWQSAEDFILFRKLQHFSEERFVYIIQDYEPSMLYRWGSEYIRSKMTLEDGNYYPIYNNSEFVCGYMKKIGLISGWNESQILHGEPCKTSPLPISEMDGENIKIVFYSRPTVDKNIYDIKINALKLFIDYIINNFPDKISTMEIVGIGEDAPDVLYRNFTIKNLGKISYKEYPKLLNKFNIGLSCIISPAFAYPCLEFPRAGLVTVVNKFENRELAKYSSNIVSCDNSAQSIFDSLVLASKMIHDKQIRYFSSEFTLPGVSIEYATNQMLSNI